MKDIEHMLNEWFLIDIELGGQDMTSSRYFTIPELARALGLSRGTVYNWVKRGDMPATKVGKTYVITDKTVNEILGKELSPKARRRIEAAVKETVRQYGKALKRLSQE
jgi:excisionase family DNA binding protein